MRLLLGSDFHGLEEAYIAFSQILVRPEYDLGILAGDLTTYVEDKIVEEKKLLDILRKSKKHIFFIMGNDDGILGNDWRSVGNVININLKRVKYREYDFVGYCYTNPFVGGKFEKTELEQEKDFERIRKIIRPNTILVTHGPAYGTKDIARDGKHVGSMSLKTMIQDERILLNLCGHIHNDIGFEGKTINMAYPKTREFADIIIPHNIVKNIKE